MADGHRTTTGEKVQDVLDCEIVTVERAAADLRRGLAVVISDGTEAIMMQSTELLTDLWIDRLHDFGGRDPVVGLTYNRANILHILPRSGNVALVKLPDEEQGSQNLISGLIQSMADPADDLMHPLKGPFHVAEEQGGQLHEAGLKLCKIARLLPAAIFSSSQPAADGIDRAVARHYLHVEAENILNYDHKSAMTLHQVTSAKVPLSGAKKTTMVAFRPDDGGTEHFALIIGDPNRHDPVLTRIHSECFTGDLLGSLKCDCGEQLNGAIRHMQDQGGGLLLYLAQEGRGIGLINKLRAYQLQDQGFDTVDANERLGFQSDERIFEPAAKMLEIMGFSSVRLLTNNPLKVEGLEACGIDVVERVSHSFPSNAHNDHYLATKKKRSGHLL